VLRLIQTREWLGSLLQSAKNRGLMTSVLSS